MAKLDRNLVHLLENTKTVTFGVIFFTKEKLISIALSQESFESLSAFYQLTSTLIEM